MPVFPSNVPMRAYVCPFAVSLHPPVELPLAWRPPLVTGQLLSITLKVLLGVWVGAHLPCVAGVVDGSVRLAPGCNVQSGVEPCNGSPVGAGLHSCCNRVQGVVRNDLSAVEGGGWRRAQRYTSEGPRRPANFHEHDDCIESLCWGFCLWGDGEQLVVISSVQSLGIWGMQEI